jgi:small subunit ribosomal protein S19|uniref:Small ribosomal subunit protein uS19c n=1 Tax=Halamphora calidilacuna TaxID=2133758 RepID=A0A2R4A3N4_9STRA|nr:ribosomal protein S19 [Halamphora calidilacuna]
MSRSKWKGPYLNKNIAKNLQQSKKSYKKLIVSRNSVILPTFIDKTFEVYNGKKFNEILVTEEMIGHKFGEFSATRKRFVFKDKKKTKK